MRNLKIESILLVELDQKKARKINFAPGINFLTSGDNHLGKSSILKSLYHALGANALFTSSWRKLNIFYCLDFSVDSHKYRITRHGAKSFFRLYENGKLICKANDISKTLATKLGEIYGFSISLVGKDKDETFSSCPPMFYYLPYYIDQENGWVAKDAKSFDNIQQFDLEQRKLSYYYHFGVFDANYAKAFAQKRCVENSININNRSIDSLQQVLATLRESANDLQTAFDEGSLKIAIDKHKVEMSSTLKILGDTRKEIINLENERAVLLQEKEVLARYIKSENKISKNESISISIEDVSTEECPKCGCVFKSQLAKKLEKQYLFESINSQFVELTRQLISIEKKIAKDNQIFREKEQTIKMLERLISDNAEEYDSYIKGKATHQIIADYSVRATNLQDENAKLKELQKNAVIILKQYEDEKRIAHAQYNIELSKLFVKFEIPSSQVKNEYEPGEDTETAGAYEPRALVARLLAFVRAKHTLAKDVLDFPIVIDSPNVQDQSEDNFKMILEELLTLREGNQVIVGSVRGREIAEQDDGVNVITLTNAKEQLLCEEDYFANEKLIKMLFADI